MQQCWWGRCSMTSLLITKPKQSQQSQGVNLKLSEDPPLPRRPCFYLFICGIWAGLALKKQILICWRRLFPEQRNTVAANVVNTKWMSDEAFYGLTRNRTGWFFRLLNEARPNSFAQRNFYSLHTIASYNSRISLWACCHEASHLMDLCIRLSTACVLKHMMSSYMSRRAVGHNNNRRF